MDLIHHRNGYRPVSEMIISECYLKCIVIRCFRTDTAVLQHCLIARYKRFKSRGVFSRRSAVEICKLEHRFEILRRCASAKSFGKLADRWTETHNLPAQFLLQGVGIKLTDTWLTDNGCSKCCRNIICIGNKRCTAIAECWK